MTDREHRTGAVAAEAIGQRTAARRSRRRQLLGIALIAYGAVGVTIFLAVAGSVARPLERARTLSSSVEQQRAALVESLDVAEQTIGEMATGVQRMDTSLAEARSATERASGIAGGVALSMVQLADAMNISILGSQPLIGLSIGFRQSGDQLNLLAHDLATIGSTLDTNRTDVVTVAASMRELSRSVSDLGEAVEDSPSVEISAATLDRLRLAIYAVLGWLVLQAIGFVLAGLYLISRLSL